MALSKSHFFAYDLVEYPHSSAAAAEHLRAVDAVSHTEERHVTTAEVDAGDNPPVSDRAGP
jgi:hypothetical protein